MQNKRVSKYLYTLDEWSVVCLHLRCFFVLLCFTTSETKSLFDRSSIMDRKETLPPLPEMDSPPMSPRKQLRPIKAADSQNSQQGRSVDELKDLIRKKLQNNYQAFEEVNFVSFCYVNAFRPSASAQPRSLSLSSVLII